MSDELLQQIQRMQFNDRGGAEALLLSFIQQTFPDLNAVKVELRPLAVSLNSFNGFLTCGDGQRLFFKTHVEQDGIIGEYYNAAMLAEVGYPIIQPIRASTQAGQQLLIYEVIDSPSVFDVARGLERQPDEALFARLTAAQHHADDILIARYEHTRHKIAAQENVTQPVHQLFYHRLTGGRLERFYGDSERFTLPHGVFDAREIRRKHWTINGSHYNETLDDIIARAIVLLNPSCDDVAVVGHGDAHNGNVFLTDNGLVYFDPAFAGKHHPLLDLTKPLFHNVFAMWMYFAEEEAASLTIDVHTDGESWHITHDYPFNAVRRMFWESKTQRVLAPTLRVLRAQGTLREDWRLFLKASLFCCPFLTLNLTGFPPKISLLGLAMAVQMGSESTEQRSLIDSLLDAVERALD